MALFGNAALWFAFAMLWMILLVAKLMDDI